MFNQQRGAHRWYSDAVPSNRPSELRPVRTDQSEQADLSGNKEAAATARKRKYNVFYEQ